MAIGQLFLTYPSRHTSKRPLANPYLHAAVAAGVVLQLIAASLPASSGLLGNAGIPAELWGVVFGGALLAWGLAEGVARAAWRSGGRSAPGVRSRPCDPETPSASG
jgi:Ca2+-transporting ATPase